MTDWDEMMKRLLALGVELGQLLDCVATDGNADALNAVIEKYNDCLMWHVDEGRK